MAWEVPISEHEEQWTVQDLQAQALINGEWVDVENVRVRYLKVPTEATTFRFTVPMADFGDDKNGTYIAQGVLPGDQDEE